MATSQINRRINRGVLDADRLVDELRHDPQRHAVFAGLRHLLGVRRQHPAFSPFGTQRVEALDDCAFVLPRAVETPDELICLTNVTGATVMLPSVRGLDVLTGQMAEPLTLERWGYAWVRPLVPGASLSAEARG